MSKQQSVSAIKPFPTPQRTQHSSVQALPQRPQRPQRALTWFSSTTRPMRLLYPAVATKLPLQGGGREAQAVAVDCVLACPVDCVLALACAQLSIG